MVKKIYYVYEKYFLRYSVETQPHNLSKQKTSDEAAFVAVLEAHQGVVHKVCRIYAHTTEARRDLFQDIVVQLWRAWPSFQHKCKISTWMYRIALNVAISGLRRRVLSTDDLTDHVYQIPDYSQPEVSNEVHRLYAALEQLSPVEKSLALLMLEDHSYDEMAQITGLTAAHLRVKTHRLRDKLRSLIQQQMEL